MSDQRAALAREVTKVLEEARAGSAVRVLGSLARGDADGYSDIDLAWVVPDEEFAAAVGSLAEILEQVRSVVSIRSDPDFQRSGRRRLVFVRFAGVPLFWRLDLEMWAASVAFDARVDTDDPEVRGDDWSLAESACMNGIAAVKAVLRAREQLADELLVRGFARIDRPDPRDTTTYDRVRLLATEAVRIEPRLHGLATEIHNLVDRPNDIGAR